MTEADSTNEEPFISRDDRALMRRLTILALVLLAVTAAGSQLIRMYSHKFWDLTGSAEWMWAQHRLNRNVPVVFYAAKTFDLPPQRIFTRVKIVGDPEYTLYFNGKVVGGRRLGDERRIDAYDVSEFARDKGNRILVAVRSVNGVGGLLVAVDIGPEHENFVVSDSSWKVYRRWSDELPLRDVSRLSPAAPMILGQPPVGRWNYLTRSATPHLEPEGEIAKPVEATEFKGQLPAIRVEGGVAVEGTDSMRATVFDFGPAGVSGRVRLRLDRSYGVPPVVYFRFANSIEETRLVDWRFSSVPFAPGETVVTDFETHGFRYLVVYGGKATAEVVRPAKEENSGTAATSG